MLERPALFEENAATRSKTRKDFSWVQRVGTPEEADVFVVPLYLELLEYWGQSSILRKLLHNLGRASKPTFVYWNHDNDFAQYNSAVPPNVTVLNHGFTSSKGPRDLLLPHWNVDENPYSEPKTQLASFIGTENNDLRRAFVRAIRAYNHPDIQLKHVHGAEYLRELSRTTFTLCPRGGPNPGGFSYRVFEAIQARSIPVVFVDVLTFPMSESVDWTKLCLRFPESMVTDIAEVHRRLREVVVADYQDELAKAREAFSVRGVQRYILDTVKGGAGR